MGSTEVTDSCWEFCDLIYSLGMAFSIPGFDWSYISNTVTYFKASPTNIVLSTTLTS